MVRPLAVIAAAAAFALSAAAQPADVLALGGADAATEAVFVRALTAQWLGDHEEATTLFERVLERRPDEPAVLAALARSQSALGRDAEAILLAARAVHASGSNPALLIELAGLQRDLGRGDDAAATLEKALRQTPHDQRALSSLAEIHEFAGRPAEAIGVLERMLAVGGEDESVRLRLHTQLVRRGDPEAARASLVAGAEALPAAHTLRLRLARAYRDAGRQDSAVAVLDDLLRRNPSHQEAGALRDEITGVTRAEAADDPAARLRRAGSMIASLDEDPTLVHRIRELVAPLAQGSDASPEALRILGLAEHRAGDYQRAAELLGRALDADPRHPEAWVALIEARLGNGDPAAAARSADEALVLFPGRPTLLEAAAAAYSAAGRPVEARAAIDEALALDEVDGLTEAMRSRLIRAREALQ